MARYILFYQEVFAEGVNLKNENNKGLGEKFSFVNVYEDLYFVTCLLRIDS